MEVEHEEEALVAVQERLGQRFPEVDAVIEAAARLSHAELSGPVADVVPLLVERAARDRLVFAIQEPMPVGRPSTLSITPQPLRERTTGAAGTSGAPSWSMHDGETIQCAA